MDFNEFKINFANLIAGLSDRPAMSADELKAYFDANPILIRDKFNEFLEALNNFVGAEASDLPTELAKKVDKIDGKGLSEADFTNVEKDKLAGLSSYDDTEIREIIETKADKTEVEAALTLKANSADVNKELSDKVNKEEGKALSDNNYTTEEKEKLAQLENYDDTALAEKVASIESAVLNKVDAEVGKGLSTNDYTDDEKNKIRVVKYNELTGLDDGLYFVVKDSPITGGYKSGWLLVQTSTTNDLGEYDYTQIKYDNGIVFKRNGWGSKYDFDAWTKISPVSVEDKLTSTSAAAALSANMGRELSEKINELETVSVKYKGEVEEDALPTENIAVGDVYKISKTTTETVLAYYVSGEFIYNSWEMDEDGDGVDEIISEGTGFSESVGISLLTSEEAAYDYTYKPYSINIYNADKEFIISTTMMYLPEIPLWDVAHVSSLTLGDTYYIERADGKIPADLEPAQIEKVNVITKGYAIYNGSAFDKIYTAETVDKSIADTEAALNEKIDGKADTPDNYELIETITLEEDVQSIIKTTEPNGTSYNFDRICLYVHAKTTTSNDNLRWNINGGYGGSVSLGMHSSWEALSTMEAYCDKPLGKKRVSLRNYTNSWSNIGGMGDVIVKESTAEPIYRILIYTNNTPIPAGTTFEIWGVRA